MHISIPVEMENSTKEQVLRVLATEWPLSTKKIHNKLKKLFAKSITYQAVHKTLELLMQKGIILKQDKDYLINIKWIKEVEIFVNEIQSSYSKGMQLLGIKDYTQSGDMQVFTFESYGFAEKHRKRLQTEYMKKKKDQTYIGISHHYKSPIIYSEKSLRILELIEKSRTTCYMIVGGTSPIDKWFAKYYMNCQFVHIKTGKNIAFECETMVLGNTVVQTYVPEEIKKYIDNIYRKSKRITDINIPDFHQEVYNRKIDTRLVILKNSELAHQIREQVLTFFKSQNYQKTP